MLFQHPNGIRVRSCRALSSRARTGREACCFTALFILICIVFSACSAPQRASAQEDDSNPWPDILSGGVLNTQTRLWFYDGEKPVLIPNGSLEEILSLRNEFGGDEVGLLPNWNYADFRVNVDASASASESAPGIANIQVQASVDTGPRESVATIPLRLDSLRLTELPTETVEGRSSLRPSNGGWEWLLAAKPDSIARIALDGKAVITSDGERFAFRLALPMTVSNLQIVLPSEATDIRVSNDDVMQEERLADETTVNITSSGGTVDVTWRVGAVGKPVAAVEANSISTFSVREPDGVWAVQTRLELQWFGRNSNRQVRVFLPAGAKFRSAPRYNFDEQIQISRLSAGDDEREQLLIENFDAELASSVEVQVDWELLPDEANSSELGTQLRMPSLDVEGVNVHRGSFELLYPSQYAVSIQLSRQATLLQQARTEDAFLGRRLSFGFDDGDFDLRLMFRREQALPIVRPTYALHADTAKLTLVTWLDCSFDPNQLTHELGLSLQGWELEENSAVEISAFSETNQQQQSIVIRPVAESDGLYNLQGPEPDAANYTSGQRERRIWKIVAYRPWTPGDPVELQLPELVLGKLGGKEIRGAGSGVLLLSSTENVLLSSATGVGLLTDTFSSMYLPYLPDGISPQRDPQVFRFQNQAQTPSIRADSQRLSQQIVVRETVELILLPSQIEIRQQYELNVANDPIRSMAFAVHQDPDSYQPPQVYVDGNLVAVEPVDRVDAKELWQNLVEVEASLGRPGQSADGKLADGKLADGQSNGGAALPINSGDADGNNVSTSVPTGEWTIYRLVAPPSILGESSVEISTGMTWSQLDAGRANQIAVPLVVVNLPVRSRLLQRQAVVRDSDNTRATWAYPAQGVAADGRGEFSTGTLQSLPAEVGALVVKTKPTPNSRTVRGRVENAWLQTAITNMHRRDRFCFQFVGRDEVLRIGVPRFVDDLQVVVDKRTHQDFSYDNAENLLIINLPPGVGSNTGEREHVVEISYFQQESVSWLRALDMKCPSIESIDRVGRFYWQLITPGTQHLASPPVSLTPEWHWVWDSFCWRRQGSDLDFEQLLGTSTQPSLAQSMNRYSMSSNDIIPARVWLLSRFALWFPVGLIAILTSFAVLNFSVFRHPLALLAYSVVLCAFALAAPGFAMLIAQTSLVALVLVFLLWATQVAVESRVRRRSVFSGQSISTLETPPGFGSNISRSLADSQANKLAAPGNSTTLGAADALADGGG